LSDTEQPPKTKRRWGRVVLWSVLGLVFALLAVAGGFYLWYQSEVGSSNARVDPDVIAALEERVTSTTQDVASSTTLGAPTTTTVTMPEAPGSMNLVLLGSDTRSTNGKGGRSDSIILVHIDKENDFLSMLSIPRDLRVKIPGHGYNKINAAYAYGGAALVIRTVQSVMGVDLDHYAETDFNGFKAITNTLGGVYVDVDRTYDDGKIQLQPGYQLLDGQNALRFCRTRHDKNIDFGRMQRQQRFLSAVREQAMGWNLALKLPSLVSSTFGNVDTDLSAGEILSLAWWGVKLDGSRMKMASIITSTGTLNGISFVLATDKQIASAVADFLTPPTPAEVDDESAQQLLLAAQELLPKTSGALPNGSAWVKLATKARFALMAPMYLPPKCIYSYQRSYSIQSGGRAIRVGYRLSKKDQYLGVGETTWLGAPLASAGKEVQADGVTFTIVGTSTKADHIWWVKDEVLCWVANTLMYELSREQLLAVAISCVDVAAASASDSGAAERLPVSGSPLHEGA
jgi:LCP family protein required for cell wall assembly